MTITIKSFTYVAENGHILRISQRLEKYASVALWAVSYSFNGVDFLPLRNGLLNKPNKRQIQNYLDSI